QDPRRQGRRGRRPSRRRDENYSRQSRRPARSRADTETAELSGNRDRSAVLVVVAAKTAERSEASRANPSGARRRGRGAAGGVADRPGPTKILGPNAAGQGHRRRLSAPAGRRPG